MNLLVSLIRGVPPQEAATANIATAATGATKINKGVATVATVAVAVSTTAVPVWCSKTCERLEDLDLPDGKVMGCVQEHPDWLQQWRRLDSMKNCPLRR